MSLRSCLNGSVWPPVKWEKPQGGEAIALLVNGPCAFSSWRDCSIPETLNYFKSRTQPVLFHLRPQPIGWCRPMFGIGLPSQANPIYKLPHRCGLRYICWGFLDPITLTANSKHYRLFLSDTGPPLSLVSELEMHCGRHMFLACNSEPHCPALPTTYNTRQATLSDWSTMLANRSNDITPMGFVGVGGHACTCPHSTQGPQML